jgi:hypothetical protein
MDRRRTCELLLLTAMAVWCGCSPSAPEQSYELVEAPQAKPVEQPAPPAVPAVEEKVVAQPTIPDTTKLNEPPGEPADVKPSEVRQVFAETPAPPAALQIAAMRREAVDPQAAGALEPLKASPETLKNLVPNKIELKVPHKDFSREGRERALRVSFDDLDLLRVLNMEPVPLNAEEYLPAWLKGLNGEKVRLKGWMFPPLMTEGLPAFLFVRDNQICCFGREAKVYDKVRVTMKEETTTDYIFGRPFDVIGTFHIESEERDGELYFLY